MELKALHPYRSAEVTLAKGETTEGKDVTEEKKRQMLTDFPDRFVEVGTDRGRENKVVAAESKEAGLRVETLEGKQKRTVKGK